MEEAVGDELPAAPRRRGERVPLQELVEDHLVEGGGETDARQEPGDAEGSMACRSTRVLAAFVPGCSPKEGESVSSAGLGWLESEVSMHELPVPVLTERNPLLLAVSFHPARLTRFVRRNRHRDLGAPEVSLAARQRGLVTREQLRAAGMSERTIDHRLEQGRLHRVFRGVYLVGHPVPPPLARELAALLACGADAVLSHHTAAALWRVLPPFPGPIHLTVPGRRLRSRPGLRTHVRALGRPEVRTRHGLRLTSPARTLQDLTPSLDGPTLERAINEAQVLHLATAEELGLRDDGVTRSDAERHLRALLRSANLHPDRFNTPIEGHLVDALFTDAKLVLEVDGYRFHRTRARFESDRRRDADLTGAGYRVMRITWRQMTKEREATVARIAATLALRPPAPG